MSNAAYYTAEQALRDKLATMDEKELRAKLDQFVKYADTGPIRELFSLFGVVEQVTA